MTYILFLSRLTRRRCRPSIRPTLISLPSLRPSLYPPHVHNLFVVTTSLPTLLPQLLRRLRKLPQHIALLAALLIRPRQPAIQRLDSEEGLLHFRAEDRFWSFCRCVPFAGTVGRRLSPADELADLLHLVDMPVRLADGCGHQIDGAVDEGGL